MKDLVLLEEPQTVNVAHHVGGAGRLDHTRVLDINTAVTSGIFEKPSSLPLDQIPDVSNGAPNIALNVRNSTASSTELWIWAIIGTALQISAIAFPALTTYHLRWEKGASPIAAYGYPCFATGTVAVVVGMIFCGRVIEGSTTEHEFTRKTPPKTPLKKPRTAQVMRLQKACTVSDQHFPSFAIFNSAEDCRIRTSRLNKQAVNNGAYR